MLSLRVLSGNGPRGAMRQLCKEFAQASGAAVVPVFDANPDVIARAQAGEAFDVAVGNPPTIEALIKSGHVVAGSRADIGSAGLAVAVQAGAAKPDISTADAFKRALLAAKAVAYPFKGASGQYFVALTARLGIAREMQARLKPMAAEDCVEVVARGEADMVVVVATRITGVPGVDVVAPIPEVLQTRIGFAAGLSAASRKPDTAKALIAYFSGPGAAQALRANGVEPAH
jgi:molybdate transport system substrate-binding protein